MLTKLERKILSACNKYSHQIINTADIQKYCPKLTDSDIAECCSHLNESGYFEVFSVDLNDKVVLLLNYKGHHYREFSWISVKEFLMKSVLVPIVVSVAAALITLWLQGLL